MTILSKLQGGWGVSVCTEQGADKRERAERHIQRGREEPVKASSQNLLLLWSSSGSDELTNPGCTVP